MRAFKYFVIVHDMNNALFISHSFSDEDIESKVRWFRSQPIETRMEMMCTFIDFILSVNSSIGTRIDIKPIKGRIQIISNT